MDKSTSIHEERRDDSRIGSVNFGRRNNNNSDRNSDSNDRTHAHTQMTAHSKPNSSNNDKWLRTAALGNSKQIIENTLNVSKWFREWNDK